MGCTLEEIITDEKTEIVESAKIRTKEISHEITVLERRQKQGGPACQGERGDAE